METKILNSNQLEEAAKLIKAGELVSFPTETVYGLGADATNEHAVVDVYRAKGRPSDNPLIVHIADKQSLNQFVEHIPEKAEKLIAHFWPGSLTLIFPIKLGSLSPKVTGGLMTAAFRMPKNQVTLDFITKCGRPLVGPSANTSGKPSPTSAEHVYHDLQGKIAGILDDGPCEVGVESTVLDMSGSEPVILRPGAVTKEALEKIIGPVSLDQHLVDEKETPKAPGMKYKHYSPNAEVYMIDYRHQNWQDAMAWAKNKNQQVGILASQPVIEKYISHEVKSYSLGKKEDIQQATKALFSGLRQLDQEQVDVIFAETFPATGLGVAYMNRLEKSSGKKYFTEIN